MQNHCQRKIMHEVWICVAHLSVRKLCPYHCHIRVHSYVSKGVTLTWVYNSLTAVMFAKSFNKVNKFFILVSIHIYSKVFFLTVHTEDKYYSTIIFVWTYIIVQFLSFLVYHSTAPEYSSLWNIRFSSHYI